MLRVGVFRRASTLLIQQLYLSPRPLSLVRLFDFSLYICITYKGFHDELAALSAMVSARLAPPFSS